MPIALAVCGFAACVPHTAPVGEPVAEPTEFAAALVAATIPAAPRQAAFAWTLDEAGTRLAGRGVARFEAPERLRLDLFGPRGETYLAAAVVGSEARIPVAVSERIAVPSAALLWGALGVARPNPVASLLGASSTDSVALVRYSADAGERIEFRFTGLGNAPLLERVERIGSAGVIESVSLRYSAAGTLQRAHYRNWAEFRELTLFYEMITDVAPFSETIWNPAGAGR